MIFNISFIDKMLTVYMDKGKRKKILLEENKELNENLENAESASHESLTETNATNDGEQSVSETAEQSADENGESNSENNNGDANSNSKPAPAKPVYYYPPIKTEFYSVNVPRELLNKTQNEVVSEESEPEQEPQDETQASSDTEEKLEENNETTKEEVKQANSSNNPLILPVFPKGSLERFNRPQRIVSFNFDKRDCETVEYFLENIFSLDKYFTSEFITQSKLNSKNLILPDEIVGFETLTIPSLNPWKANSAIKLKLSVDFNDFQNLNTTHKSVIKVKPNTTYAIQFLRRKVLNEVIVRFKNLGINFKSVNFYSSVLADFYVKKLQLKKQNAIFIKVEENHTTILAVSQGFVILTHTLSCGKNEILKNSPYRADEHSKKMTAYKFICYEISNINSDKNQKKEVTLEKIEKDFPQTRTNLLAPVFQMRNIYSSDLVNSKISEIIYYLKHSDFLFEADKIYIDTDSEEIFNELKNERQNAFMVTFSEKEIFEKIKQNSLLNFNKIKNKSAMNFSWSGLWKKLKKEV